MSAHHSITGLPLVLGGNVFDFTAALAWLLRQPGIAAPIASASKPSSSTYSSRRSSWS